MNEHPDPYQAPASSLAEPMVPYPVEGVGAGRRFLGFAIDYASCLMFAIPFLVFLRITVALTSGDEGLDPDEATDSGLRYRILGLLFFFC
jgi:hypothetical protein